MKIFYYTSPVSIICSQPLVKPEIALSDINKDFNDLSSIIKEKLNDKKDNILSIVDTFYEKNMDENHFSYDLIHHIAPKGAESNVLLSFMGALLLVDLSEYSNVKGVSSILVDHFEFKNQQIQLVFKIVADDSTDLKAVYSELEGQLSDGWGENGTEEVSFLIQELNDQKFFSQFYPSTNLTGALIDHEIAIENDDEQQIFKDMMNKSIEDVILNLTYNTNKISFRLTF